MISRDNNRILVEHDGAGWSANHSIEEAAPGPVLLQVNGAETVRNVSFYIDDLTPESALIEGSKAFHRGGAAVVEIKGRFPFGTDLKFQQICRYAQNHMRVAFDLRWPRRLELKRHLGIGCLELPGQWSRIFVYPPARHLAEGAEPGWQKLPAPEPEEEIMAAHWHRPPLAVVFERQDGMRLEIGAGNDLWRWNEGLGYGPEAGSFKILVGENAIRYVREPLMCCTPFTPRNRLYRFKWYAAWQGPNAPQARSDANAQPLEFHDDGTLQSPDKLNKAAAYKLDFSALLWPVAVYRAASQPAFLRGERQQTPCWQSNAARNLARKVIRQIKERLEPKPLHVSGLMPGPCWDPAHLDRNTADGLPHWDLTDLLDFSVWARRQLEPEWNAIHFTPPPLPLPSLAELFQSNGFET